MERFGKVFKMGVKDIGTCRVVDGYVRGKNLKNIVRNIDHLSVVTDKIGDRYNEAIAHYPERDFEKGDCWGLLVQETEKMTYFNYSFVNQPNGGVTETAKETEKEISEGLAEGLALNDLDKVLDDPEPEATIEVHPAEPAEVIPVVVEEKAPKAKKPSKKAEKKAEKKPSKKDKDDKTPKTPKGGAKETKTAEKKEKAPKKSKYAEGVKSFLRKQAVALEALMWAFNPVKAEMVYA